MTHLANSSLRTLLPTSSRATRSTTRGKVTTVHYMKPVVRATEIVLSLVLLAHAMDERVVGPTPRVIADLVTFVFAIVVLIAWSLSALGQRPKFLQASLIFEKALLFAALIIIFTPRSFEAEGSSFRSALVLLAAFLLSASLQLPTLVSSFSVVLTLAFFMHVLLNIFATSPWADPGARVVRPTNSEFAFLLAYSAIILTLRIREFAEMAAFKPWNQPARSFLSYSLIASCLSLYIPFTGVVTVSLALAGGLTLCALKATFVGPTRSLGGLAFASALPLLLMVIAFSLHLAAVNVPNFMQPETSQQQPETSQQQPETSQQQPAEVAPLNRAGGSLSWRVTRWQDTAGMVHSRPWSLFVGLGPAAPNQHNAFMQLLFGGGLLAVGASIFTIWRLLRHRTPTAHSSYLPIIAPVCIFWLAWSPSFVTLFLLGACLSTADSRRGICQNGL